MFSVFSLLGALFRGSYLNFLQHPDAEMTPLVEHSMVSGSLRVLASSQYLQNLSIFSSFTVSTSQQ